MPWFKVTIGEDQGQSRHRRSLWDLDFLGAGIFRFSKCFCDSASGSFWEALETTAFATPFSIGRFYSGGDFRKSVHKRDAGRSVLAG